MINSYMINSRTSQASAKFAKQSQASSSSHQTQNTCKTSQHHLIRNIFTKLKSYWIFQTLDIGYFGYWIFQTLDISKEQAKPSRANDFISFFIQCRFLILLKTRKYDKYVLCLISPFVRLFNFPDLFLGDEDSEKNKNY